MQSEDIIAAVNAVFVEQFEIDPADLLPEKEIFRDLGLDSLDIVDMMVGLQRTFGISLRQNEELRQIVTLGDLHAFFLKLVKENPDLAAKLQKK
ncbi:MAG: acyl carrier protein [Lentisphaerae bacterium]|jgi:acyl carrier protein|nr:acyl carrier protein [Lentisphaerota bacterium]